METNEPPKNTLYIIFKCVYLKNELDDSHFLLLGSNWHAKTKLVATSPRMLLSWATCTYRAQFFNMRNYYCIDKDFGIPTALVNEKKDIGYCLLKYFIGNLQ